MTISDAYGYNTSAFGHTGFGSAGRENRRSPIVEDSSVHSSVQISEEAHKMANAANVIRARYNLRSISDSDLAAMAREMYGSGLIGEAGMLYMSILPVDYTAVTGLPKPDNDVPMDMLDLYEKKIAHQRANGADERFVRNNEHLYGILKQFQNG